MVKKCIICGDPAILMIKDTSDFYCKECAEDSFADLSYLIKVEQQAKKLKKLIEEKQQDEFFDETNQEQTLE
mgnify:FL=1